MIIQEPLETLVKESLEEFVAYLRKGPSTYGYDAILGYDRLRANRLLLQEYIDRFDSGQYFAPLTFTTVITPATTWERLVDHVLDKPRLSFEKASITHSRADLKMRISGGKQLTLSRPAGSKYKQITRVREADGLDGPDLHVRIELDSSPGTVSEAGKVFIDLRKAQDFYLRFADTGEENRAGGDRYKKIFDGWDDAQKILVLNEMKITDEDFLQPEKFIVRTHASPDSRVRNSTKNGGGAVIIAVTMRGSDGSEAGLPDKDENMHYLLPYPDKNASNPYTMNLLLGNKFLIKRLVTRGFERLENLSWAFEAKYIGGEDNTFVTGIQATKGMLLIPLKGATEKVKTIVFDYGLPLGFVASGDDKFTRFEVKAGDDRLNFEWFGQGTCPVSLERMNGTWKKGKVNYIWEYKASYQFHVETTGNEIGQLTLKPVGTPTMRHKMAPDEYLAMGGDGPGFLSQFIDFGELKILENIRSTIDTIVSVAKDIDAFRLNGLLFRSGKESAQPSAVRFPGDLTLPGYLSPARTEFEFETPEPLVLAGQKHQFRITPAPVGAVTWTAANLPGEETEDYGSINVQTGEYTAPPLGSLVRGDKRVIVTATSGKSFTKALVSITRRSIGVSPMVMQAAADGKYLLTAATIDRSPVEFSLPADSYGYFSDDPEADPSGQQQSKYYHLPKCKCICNCPDGKQHVFAGKLVEGEGGKEEWVCKVEGDKDDNCQCEVKPLPGFELERVSDVPRKSHQWLQRRQQWLDSGTQTDWPWEDDLSEVLRVETIRVTSTSLGETVETPVLIPIENQTNWFKHEVEPGVAGGEDGLRLTFRGTGKNGEYDVPAEDTTWYRVYGNAKFEDGVLTPVSIDGKPLTPYTVIAAIEDDNKYWLWTYAILPVPLIKPQVLVDTLYGPDDEENGKEAAQ